MDDLFIFVGALAIAYMVPGPDMILIMQTGATQGRRQALATAWGLAAARACHVALAAIGLAALLRTAPLAFDMIRLTGAAYLVWLGAGIIRSRTLIPDGQDLPAVSWRHWRPGAAQRGLLTNITNPKALLFCSVLLPQFVHPEQGGVAMQFVLLGAILVATGICFDLICAGVGATLGSWSARHPAAQIAQKWLFGSILIGFGLRLAFLQRLS